jgi:hypothetical protein
MQIARPSLVYINVFQMMGLLLRTYCLNEKETKYVSIYLNNDDLKPHLKIGTSLGHAVLSEIQLFILVTFKSDIPKNEVYELGDSQHILSVYCGRYIRITSESTLVCLCQKDWSHLMNLASGCIDREVIKYGRLQNELLEWRNNCFESKSFCTPPDTNVIDFNTLCNELKYKNSCFSDDDN